MSNWRQSTPTEVLDTHLALTPEQIAFVLGQVHKRGAHKDQPDKRAALELITSGRLPLIDPSQPITRWTVSAATVRNYLNGGTTLAVADGPRRRRSA